MLRYRVRLHASFFSAFLIVESNVTFSGLPKPLYAEQAFSPAERERHSIVLLNIDIDRESNHSVRNFWGHAVREMAQRRVLNRYLLEHYPRHYIYIGDVDELLDPDALRGLHVDMCVLAPLVWAMYHEHCTFPHAWQMSLIIRSDHPVVRAALNQSATQLRNTWVRDGAIDWGKRCEKLVAPDGSSHTRLLGWHYSFAMTTPQILQKLRSNSHAHDAVVQNILNKKSSDGPEGHIERYVRGCKSLHDEKRHRRRPPKDLYDLRLRSKPQGRLPPVPGWPRHPLAPDLNLSPDVAKPHLRWSRAEGLA